MYKAVLHDHLDGGLRASTAKELAIKDNYLPLINVDDIESFFNRESSESLEDYLEAFVHTTALMNSYENLERIAFEAAEDTITILPFFCFNIFGSRLYVIK